MSTSPSDQANDQPSASQQRRPSLSWGLTDFFSGNRSATTTYPGPITSAAQQANNRRRMSMSNVTGTSPPHLQTNMDLRRGSMTSVSSVASSAVDENAVEDEESPSSANQPFARRLSFGARALRDIRIPAGRVLAGNGVSPTVSRGFLQESSKLNSQGREPVQQRRQSIAALPQPINHIPQRSMTVDPMQERMLKGDFYFD